MRLASDLSAAFRSMLRHPLRTGLLIFALSIGLLTTVCVLSLIDGTRTKILRAATEESLDQLWLFQRPDQGTPLAEGDVTALCDHLGKAVRGVCVARDLSRCCIQDPSGKPLEAMQGYAFRAVSGRGTVFPSATSEGSPLKFEGNLDKPAVVLEVSRRFLIDELGNRVPVGESIKAQIRGAWQDVQVVGSNIVLRHSDTRLLIEDGDAREDDDFDAVTIRVPIEESAAVADKIDMWLTERGFGYELAFPGRKVALRKRQNVYISSLYIAGALVTLITGAIGIINILLVSVQDRRREIAIRKVEGASNADIVIQFLTESLVYAVGASIIGIPLGMLGAELLTRTVTEALLAVGFPERVVAAAVGMTITVGLVFGALPAWRASQVDPAVMLREE